jgi:hypothetical protein
MCHLGLSRRDNSITAIIHNEHCYRVEQKKNGDSGMKNNGKGNDAGSRSSGHNAGAISHEVASNKAYDGD